MNLFDMPDDGRRSLEQLRRRVEWLELELQDQEDADGYKSVRLESDLIKAKEALAQAERDAMQ